MPISSLYPISHHCQNNQQNPRYARQPTVALRLRDQHRMWGRWALSTDALIMGCTFIGAAGIGLRWICGYAISWCCFSGIIRRWRSSIRVFGRSAQILSMTSTGLCRFLCPRLWIVGIDGTFVGEELVDDREQILLCIIPANYLSNLKQTVT